MLETSKFAKLSSHQPFPLYGSQSLTNQPMDSQELLITPASPTPTTNDTTNTTHATAPMTRLCVLFEYL